MTGKLTTEKMFDGTWDWRIELPPEAGTEINPLGTFPDKDQALADARRVAEKLGLEVEIVE